MANPMEGPYTMIAVPSSMVQPADLVLRRRSLLTTRPMPRLHTATIQSLGVITAETLLHFSRRMENSRAPDSQSPSGLARDIQAYLPKPTSMAADLYPQGQ